MDGGVLIVNHQHRLPPAERSHAVYDRPDFLRNLAAPVISSRELYEWWRSAAWDQIRSAVFPSTAAATARSPRHRLRSLLHPKVGADLDGAAAEGLPSTSQWANGQRQLGPGRPRVRACGQPKRVRTAFRGGAIWENSTLGE